ncbi:hypothetical protein O6H91_11G051900 [Diphasiastrum complanatum]|uniref:Uncharacterized protein n=1 Tax=Diphasiastrum complanatum TaxID=34168 RepID=A0ACC2C902_DIPCM|nr:hypothetical protein O6H91_11G051900 [Diphasiastrum complanatum]
MVQPGEQESKDVAAALGGQSAAQSGGQPDWDGLLKWSLAHSEGGQPAHQLSEEDRKWFMEAMQANTRDVIKRMKEISLVMNTPRQTLEEQGLLEELQEHVESLDMANDLHTIGGLVPLLGFLKDPDAPVRARAAEVISTMVQNNPKSQQQVMDTRGLEYLLTNFTSDSDDTVRTKALGAISSLIRHNKSGIGAFRLANGFSALKDALTSDTPKLQRKALQLAQYLLHENPKDTGVASELGYPRLLTSLARSSDSDIRQVALHTLLEIAQNQKIEDPTKLKDALSERIQNLQGLNPEDLRAVKEERQLIDSLWQICFNQPSSLREDGLLVLPGEEDQSAPPPDVASGMFEPSLRSLAAPPRGSPAQGSDAEKPVLLLQAGHPTESHD